MTAPAPAPGAPLGRVRPLLLGAAALAVLALTGIAASQPAPGMPEDGAAAGVPVSPKFSPKSTPEFSLSAIAASIGCTADVTVDAAEVRQAACRTAEGEYRMATFAEREGGEAWLEEAMAYGGTYLVGERWVVTAQSTEALWRLSETLGGSVEEAPAHATGHTPGHGADAHADH